MTTRVDMIIETLKAYPNSQFTARELARAFMERYSSELAEKAENPRYVDEGALIQQLAAEIGGERTIAAKKKCPNVYTQDTPRPRVYFWVDDIDAFEEEQALRSEDNEPLQNTENKQAASVSSSKTNTARLSEHDLYPQLIDYLHQEMGLYCMRIDERKSRNSQGPRGNHWLHPDILALQALDENWSESVRSCVQNSGDAAIRLWSFEVKKHLSRSNIRESFFQTVSNSTWANHAYLVTASLDNKVQPELNTLCALHGIGLLLLDTGSLYDSQILIPARERTTVDWQSVDRIVCENSDFETFIENVNSYLSRRKIITKHWNQ